MQFLPGALLSFPDDVKVAWPPVKRLVVVRVHVGEPFSLSSDSPKAERPAHIRKTGERYLVGRPIAFRSSKVEPSPYKRETVGQYHAEGPTARAEPAARATNSLSLP